MLGFMLANKHNKPAGGPSETQSLQTKRAALDYIQ